MEDIYSSVISPLAKSNQINGTSNRVYSNWVLYTHFRIKNGQPVAYFKVLDRHWSKNPPLFETDSYQELEKWVELHKEEIQKQIEDKLNK